MRSVFRVLFPKANIDPASPIVAIAVKDKKGFQALVGISQHGEMRAANLHPMLVGVARPAAQGNE